MEPGLLVLAMVRVLSATNKGFRSTLAPVIDNIRDMMKAARSGVAEAHAKKKAGKGE